jgi:GTPase SAR1 family protein
MYGQVVVGPPGSGKTTYCLGMREFLRGVGRNVALVNLDPANELSARAREAAEQAAAQSDDALEADLEQARVAVDINELVTLGDVMQELQLGPNGGLVYCLEFLEANVAWLEAKLRALLAEDPNVYLLFDLPGQVEVSAHHAALRNVMHAVRKSLDLRLTAVHLVDASHCTDPSKYISAVFLALSTMMRLELPHVNVLSKVDLVEHEGSLVFNLDFYTDVADLSYLLPLLGKTPEYDLARRAGAQGDGEGAEDQDQAEGLEEGEVLDGRRAEHEARPRGAPRPMFEEKFRRLNSAIIGLIEQFSLVAFHPLNIGDKESIVALVKHIDKTNEYVNVISSRESDLLNEGGDYLDMAAIMERYTRS